jgi:hypothetical protein
MGTVTNRYANASKAYEDAMNKYAGEAGWKLALDQAGQYANSAADVSRSSGYKAARTSGYGKAASYALANDAANNAAANNYSQGISSALNNNTNTLSAKAQNAELKKGLDEMEYKQKKDAWATTLGTAGEIAKMGSVFSDENLKITWLDEK